MNERAIEPSDAQAKAELSLSFTSREMQLLRVFLNEASAPGEVEVASLRFAQSLRARGVLASEWDPLEQRGEPVEPLVVAHAHRHHRHRSDFEVMTSYVLAQSAAHMPEELLANLHSQFMSQSVLSGRI
jgi:hypothetical protein